MGGDGMDIYTDGVYRGRDDAVARQLNQRLLIVWRSEADFRKLIRKKKHFPRDKGNPASSLPESREWGKGRSGQRR
jgi:hypothetical protein